MGQRDKLKPVIYCIYNKINGKRYIGSAHRGRERWRSHRSLLRKNKHFSIHLQSSWNKYGEDNFEFQIIEEIQNFNNMSNEELNNKLIERESYWIKNYKSDNRDFGYNSRVDPNTNFGLKWPEESKKAFSESKKGKPIPHLVGVVKELWKNEEFRKNHTEKYKLWLESLTDEDKKRIAEKRLEKMKVINDLKRKNYGQVVTEEQKLKFITTGIKNGFFKTVYLYFPNGKYIGKFLTISKCLKFLKLNEKNSSIITNVVDKFFFRGLVISFTKYKQYPIDLLKNIKIRPNAGEYIVTNLNSSKRYLMFNKKSIHERFNIWENGLNSKNFINNQLIIKNYKIEILAPIIGDDNSGIGEFIENLYQDNNELSLGVKNLEKCND